MNINLIDMLEVLRGIREDLQEENHVIGVVHFNIGTTGQVHINDSKEYHFNCPNELEIGSLVVCRTAKGTSLGIVISVDDELDFTPTRSIMGMFGADEDTMEQIKHNLACVIKNNRVQEFTDAREKARDDFNQAVKNIEEEELKLSRISEIIE